MSQRGGGGSIEPKEPPLDPPLHVFDDYLFVLILLDYIAL